MTMAQLLAFLRDELVVSISNRDDTRIAEIDTCLGLVLSASESLGDNQPKQYVAYIDDMSDAIRDYFHKEEWKSSIPTREQILAAFGEG